jgi:RimJ/RimL family protein N-acetyltransferase
MTVDSAACAPVPRVCGHRDGGAGRPVWAGRGTRLTVVQPSVRLRPVEGADLPQLLRMRWDAEATGEFQWFGYRIDDARRVERRWHEDGLIVSDAQSFLTVASDDDCAGWVGWRPTTFGNFEIGAALFPPFSGRGIGTEAQRLLVDYLFTTTAHRLQAGTEVDNMAEQRALERLGFTREGIQRGAGFRAGAWRDGVTYSILRNE